MTIRGYNRIVLEYTENNSLIHTPKLSHTRGHNAPYSSFGTGGTVFTGKQLEAGHTVAEYSIQGENETSSICATNPGTKMPLRVRPRAGYVYGLIS